MDIREQLRRDHAKALAELGAIGCESDGRRAQARLLRLRHAWRIHFIFARDKLAMLEEAKRAA